MNILASALAAAAIVHNNVATLFTDQSKLRRIEIQQREAEAHRHREESANRQREQAAHRHREEAAHRQREQDAALSAATQKLKQPAKKCEEMEAAAKAAVAEVAKAKEALRQGIRPVVLPTPEQFAAAKKRIQYNPKKLHFAVCGTSGSGKSSIINAVRGLHKSKGQDAVAACVGVTECTSEITRYPDPRKHTPPYSDFVWYDIPGAGTTAVSDWQYFTDQGLFVFDFIILVYDHRFTAIDVGIVENCLRLNIPVFVVRSKADQHVANMVQARDCEPGDEDYDEVRCGMVERYVDATRKDFDKRMQTMAAGMQVDARDRQVLLGQRVYIVAARTLRGVMQQTTAGIRQKRSSNGNKIIDAALLVEDLLRAAVRRQ